MALGHYSVEATITENGKNIKKTLTIFIDEYVCGTIRNQINWETAVLEQGTVSVKSFLFSAEKPYIIFKDGDTSSPKFILENEDKDALLKKVSEFSESIKQERLAKEEKIRLAEEEKKRQEEEKRQAELEEQRRQREKEEAKKRLAEEEHQQRLAEEKQKEEEHQRKLAEEQQKKELLKRKKSEQQARIQREVESCKSNPNISIPIDTVIKKVVACFLDNPYRTLGISCTASNEEANQALDKLKKLARLKALESYKSSFDLLGIERPARDLSVAQNAMALLKDKTHKWFWFSNEDACIAWHSGKYRIELCRDGQELGDYDLFLANYLYALICDSKFETAETWKRVLNFYSFICKQNNCEILKSRFNASELKGKNNKELLSDFKKNILKPLLQLCETDDLIAVLRLHKYIKDCDDKTLDDLSRTILEKLAAWFSSKENEVFDYLDNFDSDENLSESVGQEIRAFGDKYCKTVETVFDAVLKELKRTAVRYDMIRDTYKRSTYQLMFMLNKCVNKTDAIYFANKTYPYCNDDEKQRIKNTFGAVNIKFIDWNIPHTSWDANGDNCYYGRGCEVDYSKAFTWYHKAADEGNMYSQNSVGLCYQRGHGVQQSDEQAVAWFEKAYKSGNPDGAYNLAECYFSGLGVRKNIDKALELWTKAAELGHPSARIRKDSIFSKIQGQRKAHRAKNHICHDIGFQMSTGGGFVEVTLNKPANAYLVNAQGYQSYLDGREFSHTGGYANVSPYRIKIPSSNHWYVIIDNGEESISGITASVKARSGY